MPTGILAMKKALSVPECNFWRTLITKVPPIPCPPSKPPLFPGDSRMGLALRYG